jgi:anti-sigma factor RsiW
MTDDAVTEAELDAYLDDELDLERRLAVESHLARRPEAAARFMADVRARTALRLVAASFAPVPETLSGASVRLAERLKARTSIPAVKLLVAVAAGAAFATLLPAAFGPVADRPAYVDDAVTSYETGLLRAAMTSQIESPNFDAAEIRQSTRISVPTLPGGWTITDVQVFPSDEGPAVQIMIDAGERRRISLFAVRADSTAPVSPTAVRHGATSVAFWKADGVSYALTGTDTPEALDRSAESLAAQFDGPGTVFRKLDASASGKG